MERIYVSTNVWDISAICVRITVEHLGPKDSSTFVALLCCPGGIIFLIDSVRLFATPTYIRKIT